MVAYTQNELVSATQISKQFGEYISKVSSGVLQKIGVLKNNKLNAVILSVKEYESLSQAKDLLEDIEISKIVQSRLDDKNNILLDGEDVLKRHGLSLDI